MLVDSHCHLDFPELANDLAGVLARAREAGVERVVTISTLVSRFERYAALAAAHRGVSFTVGTHPHNAADEPDVTSERLAELSRHPGCIAIGEAGLDFHYDRSPRDVQRRVFLTHIEAARRTGLPLIIHARDADAEMIDLLRSEHLNGRFDAVLHCFSSGEALARAGLDLGFLVSFSGIVTFKRSEALRDIARLVPLDRLLVETDAPYLAPEPHRGRSNEPAYVAFTARALAAAKGVSFEELAAATTANFDRLFTKATPAAIAGAA